MLNNVYVLLIDWRGHIVWTSGFSGPNKVGDYSWANLTIESREIAKTAHSAVASLRETRTCDVVNLQGRHLRCWMWPLISPEVAVCGLAIEIPAELGELTERESEVLSLLAQGISTQQIAERLDISTSSVQTYLKRSREKLKIKSLDELISFAARYFYPRSISLLSE